MKHDDFTGKSVRFNDETLRFKREQMREIVRASCFNVIGSILFLTIYNFYFFMELAENQ